MKEESLALQSYRLSKMTGSKFIFCIIFPLFFLFKTQAGSQIFFPLDNITYWSPGSSIQLPWTYSYNNSEISTLQWFFTKSGSTQRRLAVFFIEAGLPKPTIDDPLLSITGQATLEFKNANLGHNGTYTFRVTLRNTKIKESEIDVIILEQPTAVISCSPLIPIVKEGEGITCLCSATGGNPPATASWSRNGMVINGTGLLKKNLIIKNISADDTGTYDCTVRSHNLTDTKFVNITLKPKHKPRNISFSSNEPNNMVTSGYTVIITCKADAYPEASYSISFNGSQLLTDAVNGVYNISSVNDSHAGKYTCVAKNIIGNVSTHFVLTVRDRPTMISFTSNATNNIAKPGDNVNLTCVAIDGYPKPTYQIMFKGKTVSSTGVLIIENADSDDIGTYTCFASNGAGSIQKSLVFNVTESGPGTPAPSSTPSPSTTPVPSTTPRRHTIASTEKSISDKNCGGTEWYIVVIAVFCGIGIGIVFCYTVMWLCRRRREKRGQPKPSEARRAPETHDNPSVYQELDLQRMNNEDNYQSLRKTSRPVGHQEPTAEAAESSYQELDKVRGSNDDNNYQSLNRV